MSELSNLQSDRSGAATWAGLVAFLVVCLGAGGLGAFATTPEIDGWYRTIAKPDWNPPDQVFGPVWTTLFVMMAVAGWLIWKPSVFKDAGQQLSLFGVQLVLNVAWSWIFFALHQPGWAFVEIVILWVTIALTIRSFAHQSRPAAWLLVPYLAWVSFACLLNFSIWQLNAT